MAIKQTFLFHIYYNLNDSHKILFDCIYPLYNLALEKEKFEFIYSADGKRGQHLKFLFKFQNPVQSDFFKDNYLDQIQIFLDTNKSVQPNFADKSFLMDFPNNSLHVFNTIPKFHFTENIKINNKLIDILAAYTPFVMEYRIDYDEDTILTAGLMLSNSLITAFTASISERADYFTWAFTEKLPTADYYSKKDKDIRKEKQKEKKDLLEKLRRNYLEQKESIKNLLDHFSNANDEDINLPWLTKIETSLNELIELLNQEKYPLPESFKYQSNVTTTLAKQEMWPIINYIMSYFYNVLGCSEKLSYNILYFMQEHYKNEEKYQLM